VRCSHFIYPPAGTPADEDVAPIDVQARVVTWLKQAWSNTKTADTAAAAAGVKEEAGVKRERDGSAAAAPPAAPPAAAAAQKSSLASSLTVALCYINRIRKDVPAVQPRILVIQAVSDRVNQHRSVMNCVFSAQKDEVPIDSLCLGKIDIDRTCTGNHDYLFMQQASHLTGGIHSRPETQGYGALLQFMLTVFLPDKLSRTALLLPKPIDIDNKAVAQRVETVNGKVTTRTREKVGAGTASVGGGCLNWCLNWLGAWGWLVEWLADLLSRIHDDA
jgi:hypothetical protein